MEFVELKQGEFSEFAENVKLGSFVQSPEMAQLLISENWEVFFLAVKEASEIKVAALVAALKMSGGKHFELQYGPIYQEPDEAAQLFFYANLQDFVKEHGALELLVMPNENVQLFDSAGEPSSAEDLQLAEQLKQLGYEHTGLERGYNQRGESTWQYLKDLQELHDEAELLKAYNSNAKRNVKKAYKNDLKAEIVPFERLNEVADLIAKTGAERSFATHDLAYYQKIYQAFGDKIEFLLVGKGEEKHAAGLFIQNGQEFVYLFGGSDKEFTKQGSPFLLQHTAMLHALERGCSLYNFYGIAGNFDGSDGVLRFKQNFQGYIVRKLGYFYYYPSPLKHKALGAVKKILRRE